MGTPILRNKIAGIVNVNNGTRHAVNRGESVEDKDKYVSVCGKVSSSSTFNMGIHKLDCQICAERVDDRLDLSKTEKLVLEKMSESGALEPLERPASLNDLLIWLEEEIIIYNNLMEECDEEMDSLDMPHWTPGPIAHLEHFRNAFLRVRMKVLGLEKMIEEDSDNILESTDPNEPAMVR